MRILYLLPLSLFSLLLLSQCTKTQTINEITHVNVVIDSNDIPHYQGVTTIQIQNYVNKLYIDFLGREPSASERDLAVDDLKNGNLDSVSRRDLVSDLQTKDEYYDHFDGIYLQQILGEVDSLRLEDYILFVQSLADLSAQSGDTATAYFYENEVSKLEDLKNAPYDYQMGTISINEYLTRIIYNFIYDEKNMGSENFVVACFENLLKRLPSDNELTSSVSMVDGISQHLFLQDGNSKGDFINIITNSHGFFEGLSVDIYLHFLSRSPSSPEMGLATEDMKSGAKSYQDIEQIVATSAEYAGF